MRHPKGFGWVGGEQATATARAKAIDQSFRLRLHSRLRQSGSAYGAVFIRRAEALRFRSECIDPSLRKIADVCLCEYTSHGHCGVVARDGDHYEVES
jgi:hypothetical protein